MTGSDVAGPAGVIHDIGPAIESNPVLGPLVREAAEVLAEEAAGTSMPARAAWQADTVAGEPAVVVRISDELGSVTKRFTRSQLADANWNRYQMIRLWGDLLAVRSREMLNRLRDATESEG